MIGDVTVSAKLIFQKLSDIRQNPFEIGDVDLPIHVTGKYSIMDIRAVTTADGTLPLGDIGTIGCVGFRNLGASLIDAASTPVITNFGSAGATTYTYKVVARQADGGYSIASGAGSTATGNASLSGSNYNIITWAAVDNAVSYDVYRTVGGATQGKIISATTAVTGNDTGLTGDGVTAPSTTPYNYDIKLGSDGTLYPILLKGGDTHVLRWNAAAIHHKASFNSVDMAFLLVEA